MTINPNPIMNFDPFINKKVYQIISNHRSNRSLFIVTYFISGVYDSRRNSKGGTVTDQGHRPIANPLGVLRTHVLGMARLRIYTLGMARLYTIARRQ